MPGGPEACSAMLKGKCRGGGSTSLTTALGSRVNGVNGERWVQSKPTSNSGKEKEPLGRYIYPTDTLASGDESAMNAPGGSRLSRSPTRCALENSPSARSGE